MSDLTENAVDITNNGDDIRFVIKQNLFEGDHDRSGLLSLCARANSQIDIRGTDPEASENTPLMLSS